MRKQQRKDETVGPRVEAYRLRVQHKKRCSMCREIKDWDLDFTWRAKYRYKKNYCKACARTAWQRYYGKHHDKLKARSRESYKRNYSKLRAQVFAALGDRCACCGEDEPQFLTVDHVNSDGFLEKERYQAKLRARGSSMLVTGRPSAGWSTWRRLRREGFPRGKYQILCFNCNCGRHRSPDRVCPHQRQGLSLVSAC